MPGAWMSHTIVYVPVRVKRRETVPLVRVRLIVPRCGPFEIRTLCGRLPVHWNFTVSPDLMLSRLVPNLTCGPTLTVFVAANAGTAIAAVATAATRARTAIRRFFIRENGLLDVGGREPCVLYDAARWSHLARQAAISPADDVRPRTDQK